ncbi:ORF046 [Spodoptera frugiperda granulovirus]|uniref:ORF046 n=1 Tax=Spodoptera frugiperda granulovirus TaxID=307454 RepID=A0A0C5ASC9_9BBAC|nr:ORF046 [Spodoptera frugiperda granulovirus]AJK91707.1 ORF046 [Spodoptera frugiperda granulovirus]
MVINFFSDLLPDTLTKMITASLCQYFSTWNISKRKDLWNNRYAPRLITQEYQYLQSERDINYLFWAIKKYYAAFIDDFEKAEEVGWKFFTKDDDDETYEEEHYDEEEEDENDEEEDDEDEDDELEIAPVITEIMLDKEDKDCLANKLRKRLLHGAFIEETSQQYQLYRLAKLLCTENTMFGDSYYSLVVGYYAFLVYNKRIDNFDYTKFKSYAENNTNMVYLFDNIMENDRSNFVKTIRTAWKALASSINSKPQPNDSYLTAAIDLMNFDDLPSECMRLTDKIERNIVVSTFVFEEAKQQRLHEMAKENVQKVLSLA